VNFLRQAREERRGDGGEEGESGAEMVHPFGTGWKIGSSIDIVSSFYLKV
jgi:hypothetical protein